MTDKYQKNAAKLHKNNILHNKMTQKKEKTFILHKYTSLYTI